MSRTVFTGSEQELCAAFIREFNKQPGWVCYPETAGFDVLVVHEDGWQIGVEAKLKLNAKVADQILPAIWDERYGFPGPDYRMVIVGAITEANLGIVKMLEMLGVSVLTPRSQTDYEAGEFVDSWTFDLRGWLTDSYFRNLAFDWNPAQRCEVPCVVPDVPAGVPAPLRLTPWKERALKVMVTLRRQGFITVKQIAEHGISASVWTRGPSPWLVKGEQRGQWVAGEKLPAFDLQHPEAYAKIAVMLDAALPLPHGEEECAAAQLPLINDAPAA
ncbi:hypothetical protein [uncultured Pseudomonas sp.]|uniref:hypothetical protein n=1 Tax=uncultured Pseudomonas sp. TaxID=114707 RepID=UPI0025905DEF|nr:hypothetical protein [uncultured Pseudomonas sp.]